MMTKQTHNFVAKRIRTHIDSYLDAKPRPRDSRLATGVLISLALDCAWKFKEDNERFEPIKFLEQCSPDGYPIERLWESYNASRTSSDNHITSIPL